MDDPVRDVLERLHDALGDVAHVLLLDPGERTVVTDDQAPAHVLAAARGIATALAAAAGDSRTAAIVETATATLYASHTPGGLVAVLVGPAAWNVALARRTADPLLRDLLTEDLTARTRAAAALLARTPTAGTPALGTRAQAVRADAVRSVARSD
ncbi:hypothetical protein [Cellulomonas phragmiteti]|uniref:Roadblock/LAMTOR2 domain-containing protein n=1 Tax=Cellulomonas phragmiteti TaxID=478780 RepID=A0ABQ4DJA7_9CELL|nr:hypothetical protein [Cellulomonas phragmiteti]GIG39006.1 hypothetical protein Cph01nite_07680 [Cellulomonas phragmiteti]